MRVRAVSLKTGEKAFPLTLHCGTTIWGVFASQVKCLDVEHECEDIVPRRFEVETLRTSFYCDMCLPNGKETVAMKGRQFPIISNTCTTGHKLQGCTVDTTLANDWWYSANWVYVVLSRVRTMEGLYIAERLSHDLTKYAKPAEMKAMIKRFQQTISCDTLSDYDYEQMERIAFYKAEQNEPDLHEEHEMDVNY